MSSGSIVSEPEREASAWGVEAVPSRVAEASVVRPGLG